MAPRKSNESDKEKNDLSTENEGDVSENSEHEPIKKSGKKNGNETSDDNDNPVRIS